MEGQRINYENPQEVYEVQVRHAKKYLDEGISLTNKGYLDTPGIMTERRRQFCAYLLEKIGEEL